MFKCREHHLVWRDESGNRFCMCLFLDNWKLLSADGSRFKTRGSPVAEAAWISTKLPANLPCGVMIFHLIPKNGSFSGALCQKPGDPPLKSVGFIHWGPWMSAQISMANHFTLVRLWVCRLIGQPSCPQDTQLVTLWKKLVLTCILVDLFSIQRAPSTIFP